MAHGRVLAGRYRLDEQLETSPDGSVWRAKDSTLDRRVVLRVLRPNHPFAADVGDAARRAALIDDSRLVRVLDVGLDDGLQYVVMEHVEGDTLEALVGRSPLPAPVVRRIVGEAAESLARAAGRGLHHLRLTPRSLVVRPDGSVKVLGIAVEAAAAGLEPDHAATASRVDAVALTALVYAGLTGRWPLGDAGFPPAPSAGAGPVPPGDLAQNVPNDLDTMCVVTLGRHNDGPRTPAELAQALAPWPSAEEAPVRSLGTSAGDGTGAAGEKRAPDRTKSAAGADDKQPPAPTALPRRPSPARPAGPPPAKALPPAAARPPAANRPVVALPPAAGQPPAAHPPAAAARSAAEKSAEAKPAATQRPAAAAQSAGPPATAKPSAAAQAIGGSVRARTGGQSSPDGPGNGPGSANALFTPGAAVPDAPSPQAAQATQSAEHAAQATATVTPKEQLAIRPAPTTSPPAARPAPASSGPQPVQRPVVRTPDQGRPPPRTGDKRTSQNGPGRRHDTGEQLLPWADRWTAADAKPEHHHLDPTGPFPLVIPPEQPPREQTRFVIVAVFVMMILGLVLAVISIRDVFGTDAEPVFSEPQFSPSATTTPSPSASASGTPSAAPTAPAAGTIPVVAAIKALDPEGDRDEDTASSPRAVDGDSSTTWRSERYKSAEFGGLKDGVGLSLRLRVPAAVTSVSFDMVGAGGEVELRTGDTPDDIEETELAATSAMAGGTVTLKPSAPVRAKYVILWFTELPTTSSGFRIEVSEVRVQ